MSHTLFRWSKISLNKVNVPLPINSPLDLPQLISKLLYTFTRVKTVCSCCERVIAGPIIGVEGGDEVVPLICRACSKEVFDEGEEVDISKAYAVIQRKSGRHEN
jgi:hypothetical protein